MKRELVVMALAVIVGGLVLYSAHASGRREAETVCRHAMQREYHVGAAEAQRLIDTEKRRVR